MYKVYHILCRMLFAILRGLTNEAKNRYSLAILIDTFFTFNVNHILMSMLFTILRPLTNEAKIRSNLTVFI